MVGRDAAGNYSVRGRAGEEAGKKERHEFFSFGKGLNVFRLGK